MGEIGSNGKEEQVSNYGDDSRDFQRSQEGLTDLNKFMLPLPKVNSKAVSSFSEIVRCLSTDDTDALVHVLQALFDQIR